MDWSEFFAANIDGVAESEFGRSFSTSTDAEKIEKCLKNEFLMKKIQHWINTAKKRSSQYFKSQRESLRFREDGNRSFSRRNYEEASTFYSKAILFAPTEADSKDCLSIGYANRSAANFHLKRFHDCLEDIESSIEANYPKRLHFKLQLRKAECLFRLGRYEDVTKGAEICLKLVENDETLVRERKDEIRKQLFGLLKKAESAIDSVVSNTRIEEVRVSYGEDAVFKSMSAALTVKESDRNGRYIVTKAEIKAGDVLFVEKPFASVLLQEFSRTHCEHCHAKVRNLFPCNKCTQVVYCSKTCQRESWSVYHQVECGLLDLLQATGFGHLVLRIILVAGLPYLLSKRNGTGFDVSSTSSSHEPYLAVYSLVTNAKQMKPEDVLAYATTAAMLCTLIEDKLESYGDRVFISALMLRHCQQIICNAHAITGMSYFASSSDTSSVEDQIQTRIATALYPTVSLMNHSCEPVISSSFDGKILIVRAVKDVPIGGQVYTCYGPHYKRMPTAERRSALKQQYFFDCDCKHCTTNENYIYRCFECNDWLRNDGQCNSCGHLQDCSKAIEEYNCSLELFVTAEQKFHCGKLEDAILIAEKCLSIRKHFLYKFHRSLGETYDFIARIYSTKGLFKDSSEYLSKSLAITEEIYGFESIELANEIQKYTDVAFRAMIEGQIGSDDKFSNTRFVERLVLELQRGIRIFKLNYGSNHESTRDMIEKLENLNPR